MVGLDIPEILKQDRPDKGKFVRAEAGLDFLEYCASQASTDDVIRRFQADISVFGFDVCAAGAWVGTGAARANRFYFNTWPQDWFDLYQARGFFVHDPMVLETRRRMTPFLWSEMADARSFSVEGAIVVEAGRAYGWREVMGIPIHGPASYQGLVSMGARQAVSMSSADRAILRTMAIAVHDRAHETAGLGQSTRPSVAITPRETDCMRWVAAGKTDSETAIILGIAEATAHYHVERVKKKLGTRSRSEAVALLVLAGTV